jgi:hypothetical protein
MTQRPTSITVVAWILILSAAAILIFQIAILKNPVARELTAENPAGSIRFYAGLTLTLVCGVGILKGMRWARLLYVIWGAGRIVIDIALSVPAEMIFLGLPMFLVFSFLLFRPNANRYFSEGKRIDI